MVSLFYKNNSYRIAVARRWSELHPFKSVHRTNTFLYLQGNLGNLDEFGNISPSKLLLMKLLLFPFSFMLLL